MLQVSVWSTCLSWKPQVYLFLDLKTESITSHHLSTNHCPGKKREFRFHPIKEAVMEEPADITPWLDQLDDTMKEKVLQLQKSRWDPAVLLLVLRPTRGHSWAPSGFTVGLLIIYWSISDVLSPCSNIIIVVVCYNNNYYYYVLCLLFAVTQRLSVRWCRRSWIWSWRWVFFKDHQHLLMLYCILCSALFCWFLLCSTGFSLCVLCSRRTSTRSKCLLWLPAWLNCLKIISEETSCQRRSLKSKTVCL